MRTIEFTGQFKRDYKRESKGTHKKTLAGDLNNAFKLLAADKKLPEKYYDHPLVGNWKDHVIAILNLIWFSSIENQMKQPYSWFD